MMRIVAELGTGRNPSAHPRSVDELLAIRRPLPCRRRSSAAWPIAHSPPGHEQQGFDDDAGGHLGRAPFTVDEFDGHFDDSATPSDHPIGHLDLEAVAVRLYG